MESWKGHFLSPGGRLVLIRHVLQAIPIHILSSMDPPKSVLKRLEQIFNKFFWGSSDGAEQRIWRAWDKLAFPVDENGLGVRKLEDIHSAFVCKLWCKLKQNVGIWAKFVNRITWQKSSKCKTLAALQGVIEENFKIRIGDGSSFFWYSNWHPAGPLIPISQSPIAPALTLQQACMDGCWQTHLFEDDLLPDFFQQLISQEVFFSDSVDVEVWGPTQSGLFSVASAYSIVRHRQQQHADLLGFWRPEIPLKLSIFMWRLTNMLLPFDEILETMGFHLPSKCPFCPSTDSINHFFLECSYAHQIWVHFMDILGVPLPSDLWDCFHVCWTLAPPLLPFARLLPTAICWTLWKYRNSKLYEERAPTGPALLMDVFGQLNQITQIRPLHLTFQAWRKL